MEEDFRFIERHIAGDGEAFALLVEKYQRLIYAFMYRMSNDAEEAKDLTQKAFLAALTGLAGFRKQSSFKTWLYRIAHNTGVNHLKKEKPAEVELDDLIDSGQAEVLSSILAKETQIHLQKGLGRVPERQRMAIMLRVYEGLSCLETAGVMGCSEGAVKAHYHNGVKRLREILKESGYEIKS